MARTYARLQLGAERMNEILDMLLHRTMTLTDVIANFGFDRRSAHYYLCKLVEMGKIERMDPGWDRRYKHYALVKGAMPLDIPGKPEKSAPRKRGPKPGPRPYREEGVRQVKIAKATQVGMPRDPMIAALFGGKHAERGTTQAGEAAYCLERQSIRMWYQAQGIGPYATGCL